MAATQGPGRPVRRRIRRRRPRSSASCSTASSSPPTTRRTSTPWAGPTSSSAPTRRPPSATSSASIEKVGMDVAGKVLKMRHDGHDLIQMIGGRARAPELGPARRRQPRHQRGAAARDRATRPRGHRVRPVLAQALRRHGAREHRTYVDLITSDTYAAPHLQHGHGRRRTTASTSTTARSASPAPTARSTPSTTPRDYREYVAEHVEPWTYLKFPYLKKVGWKGFVDGQDSGVYKATPLSRLNAADGMATPLAQKPSTSGCTTRSAASRSTTRWPPTGPGSSSCSTRPSGGSSWPPTRRSPATSTACCPTETPTEGVGCVEAPRGTLTHHYADRRARHHHQAST